MKFDNICIFGNDKRMEYVEAWLYTCGYECNREYKSIDEKTLVILPPPVNQNTIKELEPYLKHGIVFVGGAISEDVKILLKKRKIEYYDYLKWEMVVSENAYLTAKGILKEAQEKSAIIEHSNCLVTGYGYCGKAIAKAIKHSGGNADIMVRNHKLKDIIIENGYGYIDLNNFDKCQMGKYSYIFNTVPAKVIDKNLIAELSSNVMIFDIASAPGGVDFDYCKENDIFSFHSLGIPGRLYPEDAGTIIAKALINKIL